jgi:hypothetical protein
MQKKKQGVTYGLPALCVGMHSVWRSAPSRKVNENERSA